MFATGTKEIQKFKRLHPEIQHPVNKIYIKVFNERKTLKEKVARRMQQFTE